MYTPWSQYAPPTLTTAPPYGNGCSWCGRTCTCVVSYGSQTSQWVTVTRYSDVTSAPGQVFRRLPPAQAAVACQLWPRGSETLRFAALAVRRERASLELPPPRPPQATWTRAIGAFSRRLRQRYRAPSRRRARSAR